MDRSDFYSEKKWCAHCQKYVRFLQNIHHSYCVECGSIVHLFSKDDWEKFSERVASRKSPAKNSRKYKRGKRQVS